jgi:hypothetical protein
LAPATASNVALRGNAFRYVWRSDAESTEMGLVGSYRANMRPERTVHVDQIPAPSISSGPGFDFSGAGRAERSSGIWVGNGSQPESSPSA